MLSLSLVSGINPILRELWIHAITKFVCENWILSIRGLGSRNFSVGLLEVGYGLFSYTWKCITLQGRGFDELSSYSMHSGHDQDQ